MDYNEYKKRCSQRWWGWALRNALQSWKEWEEHREYLTEAMKQFLHNPFQTDGNGKFYNPDGTLTKFLWNCQEAIQPSRQRLDPFLDFEEHYQKIFLKRGLLIYCEGLIEEIKTETQKEVPLFEQ